MADTKPPCLTVLGGPMAGNRFVLQDGVANILIGSDPVCAFHLPLPGVSAMHARLAVEPGAVSLWEAGSPRGVHVNDSRVEGSAVLRNGDIIWLGTPGEDDVVMLQVILPRLPSLEAAPAGESSDALSSDETPATGTAFAEAVEGETVALDPRSLSLDPEAPSPAPEPPPAVDDSQPIPLVVDTPLDAHFASAAPLPAPELHEPEEAGLVVDPQAETFVKMPDDLLAAAPEAAGHDFVLADEGMPLTIHEPAPEPPPTVVVPLAAHSPVAMPPGFEDETEDRLVVADTVMPLQVPEPHEIDEKAYRASYDLTLPPTPVVVVPPAAPKRPAPEPKPSAPSAAATRPMATPSPRPARPASPPAAKKPASPSGSQRVEPAEKPAAPADPAAKSSSPMGLYVGIGIGALVLIGGGALAVMKMLGSKAPAVAQATPPPVLPSAAPTQAPIAATPEPTPVPDLATPPPVVQTPTPAPTPSGKPTPSPSPTKPGASPTPSPKPGATPTPAAAATPAGPSADQVRAQQVAGLLTQAEGALGARQFDQAVGFYDEALKLDPGNAKASAERATAIAGRDAGRRRFVAGRTAVTTEKAAGGNISGFEGAAVQKAPDFLGRIEFEMSPSSGLKGGDPWTLKIFVVNEGKKLIRITDLTATAVVNGERSGGAAGARAKEIAPQARVQVGEMSGAWKDGTQTWSAEVLLTAKGDSLKNTLTWR